MTTTDSMERLADEMAAKDDEIAALQELVAELEKAVTRADEVRQSAEALAETRRLEVEKLRADLAAVGPTLARALQDSDTNQALLTGQNAYIEEWSRKWCAKLDALGLAPALLGLRGLALPLGAHVCMPTSERAGVNQPVSAETADEPQNVPLGVSPRCHNCAAWYNGECYVTGEATRPFDTCATWRPQPEPIGNTKAEAREIGARVVEALTVPQPPSQRGHTAVVPILVEAVHGRAASGMVKYKMPLEAGNGRDALVDAAQEAIDQAVYLVQALVQREHARARLRVTIESYRTNGDQHAADVLSGHLAEIEACL